MSFKEFWRRELWVAIHGQSRSFRIKKWIVILVTAALLYYWFGLKTVLITLLVTGLLGLCLHFLLSYLTDHWRKDWGPYKRIKLDGE
jgi:hypothetical protein